MVAAIKAQPVQRLAINDDKIVVTVGKEHTIVPWANVLNVEVIKSDITQTSHWQYLSLLIGIQRSLSLPKDQIITGDPGKEPIWIISIKYQDSNAHEQKIEYEKIYTHKANLLLREIIILAKRRGIPIRSAEYLKANPWFQKKYLS